MGVLIFLSFAAACSSAFRSWPASSSAGRRGWPGRWRRRGCAGSWRGCCRSSSCSRSSRSSAGIAADRYVAATTAETDLANSFTNFGFRGLLIASRAVFIFAVGVAVGAIVGRALPAVILAAVIATIGLAGGERVHQMILAREAVAIPVDPNGNKPSPGRPLHRPEVRAAGRHASSATGTSVARIRTTRTGTRSTRS